MPTDRGTRNKDVAVRMSSALNNTANGANVANAVDQRFVWYDVPTDADGEVATDHFSILKTDRALKIVSVQLIPQPSTGPNALTANATDYTSIKLLKAAGNTTATNTVIATATAQPTANTNGTGSWVAGVPISVNVNASNAELAANDVLFISQRKTLNGLNTPAFRLQVLVQEI